MRLVIMPVTQSFPFIVMLKDPRSRCENKLENKPTVYIMYLQQSITFTHVIESIKKAVLRLV